MSIGAVVSSVGWFDVGINLPNSDSYLELPHPDSKPNHAALGIKYDSVTTLATAGTGAAVQFTFSRTLAYIPYYTGEQIEVTNGAPSPYNGIYTVTLCTTTYVNAAGSATGTQTSPFTIVPYSVPITPIAWHFYPHLDSLYWVNRAGNMMNFVFENRSNYFTTAQYLDNLSGAPATGYQILVHRTDSAWDEVPVSVIGGGVTTIGSPSTSYANGATISGATLTLGYATGSNPGILSTGTQTIAGAKTFNGNILGSGTTNATFAHFVGNSATPTIAAGTGAGTSPTLSISGTDQDGLITVTTGTTPSGTGAIIATITFSFPYANNVFISLTPANIITAALTGTTMIFPGTGSSNFTLNSGTVALTGATGYAWFYHIGAN